MPGIDALTAYLATSPGGMDSVAIIAASSHVDETFIITLQMVRFLTIIAIGPPIARVSSPPRRAAAALESPGDLLRAFHPVCIDLNR
jgi:uncharacterized membrane protein AbrB (regulator of aidB expression)